MNKKEYYEGTYLPQMHRFGKLTNWLGVLLCFLPCIVLGIGWGAWPEWSKLPVAFGTGAATFGFLWVMEPIGYYPVVGPVGTYMAFLSGNISNMRVPCATMAQKSAEVEPGTEEGALIGTIGMATSILINVGVLTVGVVIGSLVMSILPDSVKAALNYLLPALFGALLIQFGVKDWKFALCMLGYCIAIYILIQLGVFKWLPSASNWFPMVSAVIIALIWKATRKVAET